MGWLLAERHEQWEAEHGPKIKRREILKSDLTEATDPARRQKIGKMLEQARAEIEPLPRHSKYAALFKSEAQLVEFMTWAKGRGWSEEKRHSLWLENWRRCQLRRRFGNQAGAPSRVDWAQWFAMADAGAVDCDYGDEYAEFEAIHLQNLQA